MDFTFKIRTLTPTWTGDVSGHSTGKLQISGIIGGMRHAFEMLVRMHGGHTCNCTSADSCRLEVDKNGNWNQICPVCTVFGCTGLARSFILRFDEKKVLTSPLIPFKDFEFKNRDHNRNERYGPVFIGKWLAAGAGCRVPIKELLDIQADDYLKQNVMLTNFLPGTAIIIQINRHIIEVDLGNILRYLFAFMSKYTGLGAKIQQGWGQFEILGSNGQSISQREIEEIEKTGIGELKTLIQKYPFQKIIDRFLPKANNCFYSEYTLTKEQIVKLGFDLEIAQVLHLGYALRYRLRRAVKFDSNSDEPLPWKPGLDFVKDLFGDDNKRYRKSGKIGVSHAFKKGDNWNIRLFGNIPDSCKIPGSISIAPGTTVIDYLTNKFKECLNENSNSLQPSIKTGGVL